VTGRAVAIEERVALAPLTTLGIGGPARWFMRATAGADVEQAHAWSVAQGVPLVVLGGGSNLVVADAGVDALVLAIAIRGCVLADDGEVVEVTAGAGEPWDDVVAAVVESGGAGLECLSGIPGRAGGAPVQNIGAYGQEVAGTLARVTAFDRMTGAFVSLAPEACAFGYRQSRFKGADAGRFVICEVALRAPKGAPTTTYADVAAAIERAGGVPTVGRVRETVLAIRRRKGMVTDVADPDTASVGSFFMNPVVAESTAERVASIAGARVPAYPQADGRVKLPAAWLIERAGIAKGDHEGAVGVSTKHTLALVNRGGATAAALVRFASTVARRVEDRFGVRLRPEPVFLGFESGAGNEDVDYLLGAHD
jgi:UDP-N-acetylmuramate dehydrogenase